MEIIIQLILIVAIFKYCLKAALSGRLLIIAGYGLALAAVAFILYPIVIEQPLTIISQILTQREIVEDIALLTSAESIIGICISVYLLNNYFQPKAKRSKFAKIIKITPGVLVLCAICYFELLFFKWRAGEDFLASAIIYSAILFAFSFCTAILLRFLIKGESLKLEVKLMFNFIILVLGLLISSSVADYNISNAQTTIEWEALIAFFISCIILIFIGLWLHKINFSQKISNLLKWNK